jgi:hypothetical protein
MELKMKELIGKLYDILQKHSDKNADESFIRLELFTDNSIAIGITNMYVDGMENDNIIAAFDTIEEFLESLNNEQHIR